jgi:outer membrane protein OmpA-like peptidoglycan-associated protein
VALQGQVNGSAPIAINGAVNPLAPTAFVDLRAKADGVELTGLTPYSAKYTGYPIIKGTLTIDVHYLLDQGQLTADNHLFIDQLTFGDRVESDDATTLPVRLAVALLKNARGEIAVDVPVTGSLSDPQFSLSGVILDAFLNLLVKAATSPFSLIASAFGTQEDLDYVEFSPGLAALTPDSQHKLATIAQALQERPALRLDISGRVDPQVDREGLREARLASLIRMQKIKDVGGHEDADPAQFTPEEYDTYLTRVYKTATFPKPRDFLGLDKSLPLDEMKKLLLTNIEITDQDLQHLADRRANAVRQWLSRQVEPGRLFVVAPTLNPDGIKDKGKTTRVDLSLK